ncbi:tetratricopeptide repeat protein [bacterium]|nr:tetratricopeptide repeat protein [bacterium]
MKKIWILVALLSLVLLIGGIWLGGNGRWELQGISISTDMADENLDELGNTLKEQPDYVSSKYNLAIIYYRQQKYEEAKELLIELLNSNKADKQTTRKILYNLGNTFYRLSEQNEKLQSSLDILSQSLTYYRAVIENERQEEKYSNTALKQDEDAHFNYILVRKKLKIMQDELRKQQEEKQSQKQLYQLLTELKSREEEIAKQLELMENDPLSSQTMEKRSELLKARKENMSDLQIIKEKILQLMSKPNQQQGQQPPSSQAI